MPFTAMPNTAPTIDLRISPQEMAALARKSNTQETIGERLARLRRERGLTQVELAGEIGVAQPVLSDYERSELRLHGQLIIDLARILGVSTDELLGLEKTKSNGTTMKNRQLLRRIQQLDRLPKRDQQALLRTIDAFLSKVS